MGIVLTMGEIRGIVDKVYTDISKEAYFKRLQGSQRRHLPQEWRDYLEKVSMTIEEYNEWMTNLSGQYDHELLKMVVRLKGYEDPKKVFRYLNRLAKEFGEVVYRFREEGYINVMRELKSMRYQMASKFSIMVTIENNCRNMGYNNYQDLCDFRNL